MQLSDSQYDKTLLKRCKNAAKTSVFHSASMGFHRIADWRVGGESTHKSASSVYSSYVGRINIQTLNYPETFDFSGEGQAIRGWPGTDHATRS